ncbi:MAG TPA: LON peptidase substrate-binding domain-containing protein [Candidatus Dormibacteraeota bacterium]|nr:LON peptidase substrate-binding domain-containing protein [Candidatus Dormibacteraeota bacterium]
MPGQWLPLFPLNVVLFPHMPLPLHVFEPRYRQMIADCLEEGHSFGVVAIREGSETGASTPYDVGTLAKIVRIDRLEDGRMNLLVMGASRFEILQTAADRPYLRGRVRIIQEAGDDLDATARLTEQTATTFREYSNLLRELVGQKADEAEPPMEPELLSYLIAAALNLQVPEKQTLLAEPRTDSRLKHELRLLRKEIVLLKQMVAHAAAAGTVRTSLN